MNGLLRQLTLTLKSRTGFSASIIVWFAVAVLALVVAVAFLIAAAFVWLAGRVGAEIASLILAGVFLLVAIVAALAAVMSRRHNAATARRELAARSPAHWLDPRLMSVGIQVGRAVGWRRIVSLAALGVFAAGLAREWFGASDGKSPPEA